MKDSLDHTTQEMDYDFQDNLPIPPMKYRVRSRTSKYDWMDTIEVGQSKFFKAVFPDMDSFNNLRIAWWRRSVVNGKKYSYRTLEDGLMVWRVK